MLLCGIMIALVANGLRQANGIFLRPVDADLDTQDPQQPHGRANEKETHRLLELLHPGPWPGYEAQPGGLES